jgi:hypothetical protein
VFSEIVQIIKKPESSLLKVTSVLISDGTKLRYPEEYRTAFMSKMVLRNIKLIESKPEGLV